MIAPMLHASCLCGATRYSIDGAIGEVALCYCDQCKRANGGAFNVAVLVKSSQISFQSKSRIAEFESSPGKYRAFCKSCGSPIYSRRDDLPDVLRLRGGLIAELPAPAVLSEGYKEKSWSWLSLKAAV
jgi:hypothetical protein